LKSLFWGVLIAVALGFACNARAQSEVTLLSPNPIQETMDKLVAGFQAKTGIHVKVTYGSGLSTRKQVAGGQVRRSWSEPPQASRRPGEPPAGWEQRLGQPLSSAVMSAPRVVSRSATAA